MASSLFFKDGGAKEVGIVHLFMRADIGATGAPTIDTAGSKGIASITRNDTGDYTIALSERYTSLLACHVMMLEADDTDITFQIISQDVSGTSPNVKIGAHAAATPADPPSGSDLYVHIILKNSSV
jgi:hypothetical protein